MPNENNIKVVKKLEDKIKGASALYFTKYTGMNVAQATQLRRDFRNNSVEYKISKNTLTKIAAKNAGYDNLDDLFVGQVGIAYSKDDPSAPAKIIKDFIKENDFFKVSGILFDGNRIEQNLFNVLANLPSREEMYAKILNGLSQPMTKLTLLLNSPMNKLVNVLDNLKKVKA